MRSTAIATAAAEVVTPSPGDLVHGVQPTKRRAAAPATLLALLSDEQAAREVFGVSLRTFAKLLQAEWMPKPINALGPRLRRWSRAELEAAILNMPRQETASNEPAQLRRAKIERLKRDGVPA